MMKKTMELRKLVLMSSCFLLAFLLLVGLLLNINHVCVIPPSADHLLISASSAAFMESTPRFPYGWLCTAASPALQAGRETVDLEGVLKKAAMPNKTVIITTLNEAWAAPNSTIDLFLQSFGTGQNITILLNHLLIVALDKKSYLRCVSIHSHCFQLRTAGVDFSEEKLFMTTDYLKMMWTRINFLRQVLEKGFNFIFTDADVVWFQDPFPYISPDSDIQMACDFYMGDSRSLKNIGNGGFVYARANNRTVNFYKYWYTAREAFPGMHDQDVFNHIKQYKAVEEIGVQIEFFDTKYMSCFCQRSDDLGKIVTMHANCCFGLQNKLDDLRRILADWNRYQLSNTTHGSKEVTWSAPKACIESNEVLHK